MEPLKVGVIGSGAIASSHIKSLRQADAGRVTAIWGRDPGRLEERRAEFGIDKAYTDYRELIEDDDVEAVVVALPNHLHHEVTIAALEAGKHVLCEKPPTTRVEWAEQMAEAARRTGKVLQMGVLDRFTSDAQWLRKHIEDGELGEVYFVKAQYVRRNGIPGWGSWFTRKDQAGGGAMIDVGVHRLDLAWYLLGCPKPVSVTGVTYSKLGPHKIGLGDHGRPEWDGYFDVEDFAAAFIRFEGGAAISLEAAWAAFLGSSLKSYVLGTKKGAELEKGNVILRYQENGQGAEMTVTFERKGGDFSTPFAAQMYTFWRAIRGEGPNVAPPEQGITLTRMLSAIYESAETGREVRLD